MNKNDLINDLNILSLNSNGTAINHNLQLVL